MAGGVVCLRGLFFATAAFVGAVFIVGCPGPDEALPPAIRYDVLEMAPMPGFVSPVEESGTVTHEFVEGSEDPYKNETWVSSSDGIIGHFGFFLRNLEDSDVEDIVFIVHSEDPEKIVFPLFIEIADQFFFGMNFALKGVPWLHEGRPLYPQVIYPGQFAYMNFGVMKAQREMELEALIYGKPFQKFHIAARGKLKATDEWVATHSPTEISFFTGDLLR